jgi:small-conductance mechanosensitive channel
MNAPNPITHRHIWRKANVRLIPCGLLFIGGAVISSVYGNVRRGSVDHKLIALEGVIAFVVFATIFLQIFITALGNILTLHRLNRGRVASVRFMLRAVGYSALILMTLELLGISVGRLLLGGAVLGIILGVAAQQALGNLFASIVIVLTHPISVGQQVTLTSGALGGQYVGTIFDIGLTHTRLLEEDGNLVLLPNATLISGATIRFAKNQE